MELISKTAHSVCHGSKFLTYGPLEAANALH